MPRLCEYCHEARAQVRRPRNGDKVCKECFLRRFEDEIHEVIVGNELLKRGERVALGASGGKDSTVLAHVLTTLNERHDYGVELLLLSIDEGIRGYRDDSLATVARNQEQYQLPLHVLSYKDLYGVTMDDIVAQAGVRSSCTFCGVLRRQALDRGAVQIGVTKLATGHNADDVAETVLMNLLRGDIARLVRCTDIVTGAAAQDGGDDVFASIPRIKPFKYAYEKEIVMYAYFLKLDYFSTECTYAPESYRGYPRILVKNLERHNSAAILDVIRSAEHMRLPCKTKQERPQMMRCAKCGYLTSRQVCKACMLLEGIRTGQTRSALTKGVSVPTIESADSANNTASCSKPGCSGSSGDDCTSW
ncbi:MAG: hypothetical protein MHM6MM_001691 [Cercozoa sp. M6MM]